MRRGGEARELRIHTAHLQTSKRRQNPRHQRPVRDLDFRISLSPALPVQARGDFAEFREFSGFKGFRDFAEIREFSEFREFSNSGFGNSSLI